MNKITASLPSRIIAAFMALVLAMSVALVPGTQAALAQTATATTSAASSAVTVALTIVDSTDGTVLTNSTYSSLTSNNTVADLLKAAGFTEGTQEESAANSNVYFGNNWGGDTTAPYFLGKDRDGTNYWNCYSDATSDNYSGAYLESKLVTGKHYIYVYGADDSSFGRNVYSSKVPDPLPTAPTHEASVTNSTYGYLMACSNSSRNGFLTSLVYNENMTAATAALGLMALEGYQVAGTYNVYAPAAKVAPASSLTKGILNRLASYATASSLPDSLYVTDYAVACMALKAAGHADKINTDLILNYYGNATSDKTASKPSSGAIAKLILGLTAAGVDCESVTVNGEEASLVADMAEAEYYEAEEGNTSMYNLVWTLPVYTAYGYSDFAEDAIANLLSYQETSGSNAGLFNGGWGAEIQGTAQAVAALAPYAQGSDDAVAHVSQAIDQAASAMQSNKLSSGAWPYNPGGSADIDTTCAVLVALAAAGYDPGTMKALSIQKISSLSTSTYTYNGNAKKPTPKVVYNGKTLKAGADYTVSYKSNTKVGTATVTVKGTGEFTGTLSKTFKINPRTTSIKKVSKARKVLTVTVKKRAEQVTGYQVRYSTSKSFKSYKTKTTKNDKTTKVTLSKLKSHKKYYVKVRTYTVVKGKKYYSAWSSVKSATTK